jgi:type II secretion system protein N
MMQRRWPLIAAGVPAALLLFVIIVILFTPAESIQGVVYRYLEREGYTFRTQQFSKALPLGIKARNLEIADERGALLRAESASVRLRLLPLLAGKVSFSYRVEIGGGDIRGNFSPLRGGEMDFAFSRLRLEDIPFFLTATGTRVKGGLSAQASFRGIGNNAGGEAQLEVKGAELASVKIGEMPFPDAVYDTIRGALKVSGGKAVLESATLQGAGLYARLKGDFPVTTPLDTAPLNLTLELMPKPDFLEKQKFVFLLLAKYLISPGAYQIPIRGTLAKPAIQ